MNQIARTTRTNYPNELPERVTRMIISPVIIGPMIIGPRTNGPKIIGPMIIGIGGLLRTITESRHSKNMPSPPWGEGGALWLQCEGCSLRRSRTIGWCYPCGHELFSISFLFLFVSFCFSPIRIGQGRRLGCCVYLRHPHPPSH